MERLLVCNAEGISPSDGASECHFARFPLPFPLFLLVAVILLVDISSPIYLLHHVNERERNVIRVNVRL
jgi:hypothetical protein